MNLGGAPLADWNLDHEIRFISTLGNYSHLVERGKITRTQLLVNYRAALNSRTDDKWSPAQMKMLNDWITIELQRERAKPIGRQEVKTGT